MLEKKIVREVNDPVRSAPQSKRALKVRPLVKV